MNAAYCFHGGRWNGLGVGLVAGLLMFAGFLSGCPAPTSSGSNGGKPAMEPAPVRVASVVEQPMPLRFDVPGTVVPMAFVQVKSQVTGLITKVCFQEGGQVQEGQVLFEIDQRPFEIAVSQAEANLSKARASVAQAQAQAARDRAQAENAAATLQRAEKLHAKGMQSPEVYEGAAANAKALEAAVSADEASIVSARESIAVAEAALQEARLQLDYCTIRAAISGKAGAILAKQGNLARANDTTALTTINQLSPIYVEVGVPDRYFARLQTCLSRGPVEITAQPENGEPARGQVQFTDNAVDEVARNLKVRAVFENGNQLLWPMQFVRATVELPMDAPAVAAPSQAVLMGQAGAYAWVVKDGDTPEMRSLRIGHETGGKTVILEGLQPGEQVVVDGQLRIVPKGKVRIVNDAAASAGTPAQ